MRYLLVALLAGCTTYYEKPGAGSKEFDVAYYDCQVEAAQVQNRVYRMDMIRHCLALKGWTPKQ